MPMTFRMLAAGTISLIACRAVEPTIPERQVRGEQRARQLPLSLGDEFPSQLEGPREFPSSASHLESVPPLAERVNLPSGPAGKIEYRAANLSSVVEQLAAQLGINVILDPSLDREVNVSFPSTSLDQALHAVLEDAGTRLEQRGENIFAVVSSQGQSSLAASFALRTASAGQVSDPLKGVLSTSASVAVDASHNVLVVRGPRSDLLSAASFLDEIDHARRQVLVEVRILEVTLNDSFEFGVTAAIEDGTISGDLIDLTQALGTADKSFGLAFESESGRVTAAIEAISRFAGTDLVSSPRVLALSGTLAKIEVIREVPYINTTATTTGTTGGIGSTVQEEVQFKEAGVRLAVTPTVQAGGMVQLKIDQELSEVVDVFKDIPIIDKRTLSSDFLVGDRKTVVLGGLMQKKKNQVDKGVPGLMSIPILGRLFRSDADSDQKRELLVFVTPRIVDDAEARALNDVLRQSYVERIQETGVAPNVSARSKAKSNP